MDVESSVSSLPWLWVIEALASFKQIDISVLNDLVARASKFSDNLGNNTRERVALRCLEDLFDPSHDIRYDLPSALESKIRLDLSESCEDVLRRIVSEVPTSDLRMGGPQLLKWDIHPFIMHKKACLPKCALELLKDKLVEGTHPTAALLRESSGLAVRDQNDGRTHADDGDPNPLLSRFHASGVDHQIEAGSEHFTAINSENENDKLQGDCPDKIVFPTKRDRSTSADGNSVGQFHDDSTGNGGDLYLNAKKHKVGSSSTSQAVGQDLVLVDRNEPSESSMGRTIAHTGREGCNLGEESQGDELEGIRYSKDVHNGICASKRTEKAESEHFTTLNSENENAKLQGDCPDKILFSSKRGRSTSAGGNSVGQFHDDSMGNGGDFYLNAKKFKVGSSSTSKSVGPDLVLVDRNEPSESPRGRTIAHTGREGCNLGEESQGGELEGIRYSKDVHNGTCVSKRSEQISDDNDNEQHNQLEFCHNKMPQDVSNCPNQNISLEGNGNIEHCSATSNGTQQKIDADEAKDDSEDSTSSDNDGYHNEKVEVSTKKHNFLSSQCAFNEDTTPDVWTEQTICMKCNKDGQLLYCSASGCHLVVHENCLGSSASSDNGGNFLCPFCAYSQAISKYLEAKKKASLARKKLGGLIGVGCQKKNLSNSYVRKEKQKQSRQNGDPDILVNGFVNRNLREEEDSQENNNGGNENQIDKHQTKERVDCGIQTENHQIKESIEDKQQAESSEPCVNDDPSHREEEATKLNGTLCVDIEENQGGENMVKECPSVRRIEGQENQLPADPSCDVENSTFGDILATLINWRHEGEIKEEILQQEVDDRPLEPACKKLNSDEEGISEEENDKDDVSKYEIRFRSQGKHYTYPAMPMLRRKRVAWTSEEEEVLKTLKFEETPPQNRIYSPEEASDLGRFC